MQDLHQPAGFLHGLDTPSEDWHAYWCEALSMVVILG